MQHSFLKTVYAIPFTFRKVLQSKAKPIPGVHYDIVKETEGEGDNAVVKTYLKRPDVTVNYTPDVNPLEIAQTVIDKFLLSLVSDEIAGLLDANKAIEGINLAALLEAYVTEDSTAREFSKEFRKEVSDKFAEQQKAVGTFSPESIAIIGKLLQSGFNANTALQYSPKFESIKTRIGDFALADGMDKYLDYTQAMFEKMDDLVKPKAPVDLDKLGL